MVDIGYLGGGQLARMSIQAAQRMGLRCLSLDPAVDSPASQIAPAIPGALDDATMIAEVFRQCRHVTLENEFIPADAIRKALDISGADPSILLPGVDVLGLVQDKLTQRQALLKAGVPSPRAVPLDTDANAAKERIGFPMVLKARFGGYDGKGTRYAHTEDELEGFRTLWGPGGWLAEQFVSFRRELAVMVYRSANETGCFPTMETVQSNHVCDLVFPADVDGTEVAIAAIEAIDGYGLFGVELFETEDGSILVNEIAPRPHNTGHYTLDWGGISQFEQHVRIVMRWPLDQPQGRNVCMANLLGQHGAGDYKSGTAAALDDPGVHIHWYGKAESRPGRKMGHINAVGENCIERAKQARERFYRAWTAQG
jgi:5-(carboxyamino)imidazole ribonucleotide synthase